MDYPIRRTVRDLPRILSALAPVTDPPIDACSGGYPKEGCRGFNPDFVVELQAVE